jgi:hypothetical protein
MAEDKDKERDEEIVLEVFKQRYQHVEHLQQMRATYFNIYIAVIGFSVTTMFGGFGNISLSGYSPSPLLYLSILIFIVSIFSIMRSERWGGHISHDLIAIRRMQNFFTHRYKSVEEIIPTNLKPSTSLEFDRPLWNRNRSIETPIFMTGALISAVMIAYFTPAVLEGQLFLGILLLAFSILIWRAEVSNLLKRHAKCCLSSQPKRKAQAPSK